MINYLLDENRHPYPVADSMEWARDAEKQRKEGLWRVGQNEQHGLLVSTVFLGTDHRFGQDPALPPVLFETMVFADDNWRDLYMFRYATWAEAEGGHVQVCEVFGVDTEIKSTLRPLSDLSITRSDVEARIAEILDQSR